MDIFVGAFVAFVVFQVVAVALLFFVRTPGDEVHAEPAAAELVERRDLPRRERGRREARPMRQHEVDLLGVRRCMRDRQGGARAGRVMRHQNTVEAGLLVCLREITNVVAIDDRALRWMNFRHALGLNHSDEFDAHMRLSFDTTLSWLCVESVKLLPDGASRKEAKRISLFGLSGIARYSFLHYRKPVFFVRDSGKPT